MGDEKNMSVDPADDYVKELCEKLLSDIRRCRNCNYCSAVCPLQISTRGYATRTPSGIIDSLYYAVRWNAFGVREREELCDIVYSCTTCNSCVLRCKANGPGVPLLEAIEKGRNLLVEKMIGPLKEQRKVLESVEKHGNPYECAPADRLKWLGNEKVKRIPKEAATILFFVGCTTCYDPQLFPLGRSLIRLFKELSVDFGILEEEKCCADPVGRLGDPFLFEYLVEENKKRFAASKTKTIVTTSPHCLNTFMKQYGDLSQTVSILHYTQFLEKAVAEKKMKFQHKSMLVTYHDPCYLGKHNGITDAPRNLIRMLPGVKLVEMKDNRENSICCGAGGGRYYTEVEETDRLANIRVRQALATGAEVLATACPYCHVMFSNAVQDLGVADKLQVKDIAELVAEGAGLDTH